MNEVLKSLIERGYDEGIVEIVDDDNDILFRIGECEFYLTEKGIENMTAAEYVANTPKQDIVRKVCEAFAYVHGIYDTEYCYYVLYLLEHIGTDEDIDKLRDLWLIKQQKNKNSGYLSYYRKHRRKLQIALMNMWSEAILLMC